MSTPPLKTTTEPKRRKPAAKKQAAAPTAVTSTSATPSYDQIAALARKLWMERGQPEGTAEQDWLRAEQELMGKAS